MSIERISLEGRDKEFWLNLRKQDVTASDCAALLGIHEFRTLLKLYGLKTGTVPEDEENEAMRRGKDLEDVAVKILRRDHPEWQTLHGGWYLRDPDSRLGATPDLFVECPVRGRGIVQLKSVQDWIFEKKWKNAQTDETEPPLWIAVQTILEAHLDGAQWAAVGALVITSGAKVHLVDVPINDKVIARLKEESLKFWDMVANGVMPSADYERDNETVKALYAKEPNGEILDLTGDNHLPAILAEDAELAILETKTAKRRKEINTEILDKIGPAKGAICNGWSITTTKVNVQEKLREAYSYRRITKKEIGKKEEAA